MIDSADSLALAIRFVNRVIGLPWLAGATGPGAYCCWGLAQVCEQEVFARDIPMVEINEYSALSIKRAMRTHPLWTTWRPHADPRHGDVVKMFRPTIPDHIGVYLNIERGGILHSARGDGVRFDTLFALPAMGWSKLEFWRPEAGV